jgi:heme exporter protein A
MLEVINLECVRGDRRLFKDFSFSASPGELIELRGANGSGKTSLLRIICGLAAPANGEVRWQKKPIRELGEEYYASIAYLAHQNGLKHELSPIENVRISSGVAGHNLTEDEAHQTLKRVGLGDRVNIPTRSLSAGQRRRVGLARLLTSKATLWVLDEVLTSLDEVAVRMTREFISDHLRDQGIVIVATHQDLNLANERCRRIELTQ